MDVRNYNYHGKETICSKCNNLKKCIPEGLDTLDVTKLDGLVANTLKINKGNCFEQSGNKNLQIIKAGYFKSVITSQDGREQVLGFHAAGDTIGLIENTEYVNKTSSIALEDSVICIIPFAKIDELANPTNLLNQKVREIYCREISAEQSSILSLGSMCSSVKVAYFIIEISKRHSISGLSGTNINLKMSRKDIASYLGIRQETLSRTLAQMISRRLINLNARELQVLNFRALQSILESN